MRLGVLYWFYREPEVCENHLRLARLFNPDTDFYGLYGGEPEHAASFAATLAPSLDDFYAFAQLRSAGWKWTHGDQMIVDWYVNRGHALAWDTIAVIQWDTLVCGAFEDLFGSLTAGQMLLPGLRPLREVEATWWWTSPQAPDNREVYLRFVQHLRTRHDYRAEPLCCLFLAACIPRAFLDAYAAIGERSLGFLEYKLPMYAQVFGTPLCTDHGLAPWWNAGPPMGPPEEAALNAVGVEIPVGTIGRNLEDPQGARLFHPVRRMYSAIPRE